MRRRHLPLYCTFILYADIMTGKYSKRFVRFAVWGGELMSDILQRDGLTVDILKKLSYKSRLGINLKKNLHYFLESEKFL